MGNLLLFGGHNMNRIAKALNKVTAQQKKSTTTMVASSIKQGSIYILNQSIGKEEKLYKVVAFAVDVVSDQTKVIFKEATDPNKNYGLAVCSQSYFANSFTPYEHPEPEDKQIGFISDKVWG